jgi:hypothetical protein
VRGRELRFSTRPGHAAAAFFLLALPFHDAPGAAAILPLGGVLLLVLFGLTASGPAEPDTPPCDLARWLLPLALPLVAAAALHLVEPPAVVLGKAASHGVAGVFFAALAPVLPALALAGAVAIDRVRGLRRLPGLGLVAVALLAALAFTAPWPQTELARLLGRELGSADGPPAWYGLPLLATYRAQALTCLALAAWLATRARRLFHEGRRPAWLPLVVAAAVTAFVAALRVPVAGAAGAAQASLVGALAGAAVESFGRRSPAPAVEPAPLGPS